MALGPGLAIQALPTQIRVWGVVDGQEGECMTAVHGSQTSRRKLLEVGFVRLRQKNTGLLFVLPTFLVMAAVIGYPIVRTFWLSFSDVKLGREATPFIGLANYSAVIADRVFRTAVRNSLIWTAVCVTSIIFIGLLAALTVNERFPGHKLIRSTILMPWIIPEIVAAIIWKWLYHPNFGMINDFLLLAGVMKNPPRWLLADPTWALYAIMAVNVWASFPFAMLMFLAGLQGIPEELYDAARVDGARASQRLWYVTLPLLRSVIVVVALLLTIWNMNTFTYVYVLTEGGPARITEVLGVYIYTMAFRYFKFGISSAAAVIVFLISTLLSVIYLCILRSSSSD